MATVSSASKAKKIVKKKSVKAASAKAATATAKTKPAKVKAKEICGKTVEIDVPTVFLGLARPTASVITKAALGSKSPSETMRLLDKTITLIEQVSIVLDEATQGFIAKVTKDKLAFVTKLLVVHGHLCAAKEKELSKEAKKNK